MNFHLKMYLLCQLRPQVSHSVMIIKYDKIDIYDNNYLKVVLPSKVDFLPYKVDFCYPNNMEMF